MCVILILVKMGDVATTHLDQMTKDLGVHAHLDGQVLDVRINKVLLFYLLYQYIYIYINHNNTFSDS